MTAVRLCPLGYLQLTTTLSGAVPLTVPAGANAAYIQAETANVRWRDDGVAPSATVGMLIVSGLAPFLYTGDLGALQFIAASGSPALDVSFYRISG